MSNSRFSSGLPARLGHAGNLPLECEFAKLNAAKLELPQITSRSSRELATVSHSGWAAELGEELRAYDGLLPSLGRNSHVLRMGAEGSANFEVAFNQRLNFRFVLDFSLLCHSCLSFRPTAARFVHPGPSGRMVSFGGAGIRQECS